MPEAVLVVALERRFLLSAAEFDLSFGDGGESVIDLATSAITAAMVQDDGKTLVAGAAGGNAFVLRVNANGSLDTGFGGGDGVAAIDLGGTTERFNDLAVAADGKILAGGNASATDYLLVRFKADGTPDTGSGFGGTDGIVTAAGQITAIDLRGGVLVSAGGDIVRAHDLSTGARAGTFGAGGAADIDALTKLDAFTTDDVAIREDGRVLVIGRGTLPAEPAPGDEDFLNDEGTPTGEFLIGLSATGAADNTFDADAVQVVFDDSFGGFATDGRIVVGDDGAVYTVHNQGHHGGSIVLTRHDAAGQVLWSQEEEYHFLDSPRARVALDAAGNALISTPGRVNRYAPSGSKDTTFGGDGSVTLEPEFDRGNGFLAVAPGGRIVTVGGDSETVRLFRFSDAAATYADNVKLSHSGTLFLKGTPANEAFSLRLKGSRVRVGTPGGEVFSFSASAVKRINVTLGGGNDLLRAYADIVRTITADGGEGFDSLVGGSGNDVFFGGDDDRIDTGSGGGASNLLYGQGGNDSLTASTDHDYLYGSSGDDVLIGTNRSSSAVVASGEDGNDTISGSWLADGGAGDDVLLGMDFPLDNSRGGEILGGGDGNDTLWGFAGNDGLTGGNGRDRLFAGAGNDLLRGNGGADFLYADGDAGFTDTLDGGGSPGPVTDALHADAEDAIIA